MFVVEQRLLSNPSRVICVWAKQSGAWAWLTWQAEIRSMARRDRVAPGHDKAVLNHVGVTRVAPRRGKIAPGRKTKN
ncbi:hypothetical protein L195_g016288 [Trifolium pratense]|uniref:Uncharacterized protein n=1 Tax=Trifolium pratense TaxID=57577 RepID=A0A2K3MQZ8_TRIPR|nr:hypothetical protein L195_g016288 [Trifolium pratense]